MKMARALAKKQLRGLDNAFGEAGKDPKAARRKFDTFWIRPHTEGRGPWNEPEHGYLVSVRHNTKRKLSYWLDADVCKTLFGVEVKHPTNFRLVEVK